MANLTGFLGACRALLGTLILYLGSSPVLGDGHLPTLMPQYSISTWEPDPFLGNLTTNYWQTPQQLACDALRWHQRMKLVTSSQVSFLGLSLLTKCEEAWATLPLENDRITGVSGGWRGILTYSCFCAGLTPFCFIIKSNTLIWLNKCVYSKHWIKWWVNILLLRDYVLESENTNSTLESTLN